MESKKLKLYLDTSVWNFILEKDRIDSKLTSMFFDLIRKERTTEIVISTLVMTEINSAPEPRKSDLLFLIERYNPILLDLTDSAFYLSDLYIKERLIPEKSRDDAIHIGIATDSKCDFIISWNFKHIVRAKTIKGVHNCNFREGFGMIEIISPREYLGK